jgi:hypothetical protein
MLQGVQVAELSTLKIQGKRQWINLVINYEKKSHPVGISVNTHTKTTDYIT